MQISPINHAQPAFRGKFKYSIELEQYIHTLDPIEFKLFRKNLGLMQQVNDGKEYLLKKENQQGKYITITSRKLLENGQKIMNSSEQHSDIKIMFDKLFDRYNPNRIAEELNEHTKLFKIKKNFLDDLRNTK